MIITNYMTCPDMRQPGYQIALENCAANWWTTPHVLLHLTATDTAKNGLATFLLTGLPAGASMVARSTCYKTGSAPAMIIANSKWSGISDATSPSENTWDARFTVPSDGVIRVRFMAPSGEGGYNSVASCGVYTATDWDALSRLGLTHFSGATMPLA